MKKIFFLVLFLSTTSVAQTVVKAKALWESKKVAEAKKILLTVKEDNKEYAEAQFYLGRIAFDEENYDDAEEFFDEAIKTNDKVAEYHNWYGNTLGSIASNANMLKQGVLAPQMKSAWEKAVALNPIMIEPRQSLIQYYLQAPGFMGGSVDKAIQMAKEIIKLNPAVGHRELGNIYFREKKIIEAEQQFVAMAKADPTRTNGLANFYMGQKQYGKAMELLEEWLKINPDNMMTIYQIGRASALSGTNLTRGEECLRNYLTYAPKREEPSHAGANMRLGQIMEKHGKKEEAKKLYELAFKADNTLKEAKEGLERVSK